MASIRCVREASDAPGVELLGLRTQRQRPDDQTRALALGCLSQGYQEGASEDETMADAGAQDVHCTPGCNNSRDDVVIEANSILSPPDSNTTGGLGTADAAVSLALHCTSAMHKAQVTPGGTVQCKAVDYKPHWQLHADGSDSLIKAELKSEEVATSDAVAAEQDMRQTGPAFVMGTTYGETNPHATPPTPLHNRRPSRPSTPQRQSPSDGMVKVSVQTHTHRHAQAHTDISMTRHSS